MVARRSRSPRKLFSIKLKNRITNKTLSATFYEPLRQRKYIKEHRTWIVLWNTRARISIGDKVFRDESLPNESWLSSLLLAIEGLRILIPFEEEGDWLDESGLPSWLMLPKTIHVGWGHQLHKELVGTVNTHVAKFISKIDKKRRKYERENHKSK